MKHNETARRRRTRFIQTCMLFVAVLVGCSNEPSPEALEAEQEQLLADAVANLDRISQNQPVIPAGPVVPIELTAADRGLTRLESDMTTTELGLIMRDALGPTGDFSGTMNTVIDYPAGAPTFPDTNIIDIWMFATKDVEFGSDLTTNIDLTTSADADTAVALITEAFPDAEVDETGIYGDVDINIATTSQAIGISRDESGSHITIRNTSPRDESLTFLTDWYGKIPLAEGADHVGSSLRAHAGNINCVRDCDDRQSLELRVQFYLDEETEESLQTKLENDDLGDWVRLPTLNDDSVLIPVTYAGGTGHVWPEVVTRYGKGVEAFFTITLDLDYISDDPTQVDPYAEDPNRPTAITVNPDITIDYVIDGVPGIQTAYEQSPVETQEWVDKAGAALCWDLFGIITDLDGPTTWQEVAQPTWDQLPPENFVLYDDSVEVFARFAERSAERNCTKVNESFVDGSGRRAYEDGLNAALDAAS